VLKKDDGLIDKWLSLHELAREQAIMEIIGLRVQSDEMCNLAGERALDSLSSHHADMSAAYGLILEILNGETGESD
jgi:hypothetical protein